MNEGITALASLLNLYENSADPFASIKSQVGSRWIRVEKIVTSSTKYQVIQKNELNNRGGYFSFYCDICQRKLLENTVLGKSFFPLKKENDLPEENGGKASRKSFLSC